MTVGLREHPEHFACTWLIASLSESHVLTIWTVFKNLYTNRPELDANLKIISIWNRKISVTLRYYSLVLIIESDPKNLPPLLCFIGTWAQPCSFIFQQLPSGIKKSGPNPRFFGRPGIDGFWPSHGTTLATPTCLTKTLASIADLINVPLACG